MVNSIPPVLVINNLFMEKKFYKKVNFLANFTVTVCFLLILSGCKKTENDLDPGISYGITGIEPAMAASGDTIKIYGIGFQADVNGNTVKINGVSAKIIDASSTVLSAVVPIAAKSGNISVQTGSNSNTYNPNFIVATAITGNRSANETWTPDKLYLLKGPVHFTTGSALTIQAGTTIMAERKSLASLVIDGGATVAMNGTADKPIVFTSDQMISLRNPGDWGGITLAPSPGAASDVLNYVRIEYAGYHVANTPGAALLINRGIGAGNIQYVQTSYSAGDGFRCNAGAGTQQNLKYLVAFGCAGNDFGFVGSSRVIAQFLLGFKDPLYADQLGADGLLVQSSQPVTISNLTLMGPNGLARFTPPPTSFTSLSYDDVLNKNAGSGVHIGGYDMVSGAVLNGTLQLFNSIVAAPWQAGIAVDGPLAWANYANGSTGSVIRYSSVTYTLATKANTYNHDTPPLRGYVFSSDNLSGRFSGFNSSVSTNQAVNFNQYNDSAKLQLETPFLSATNPNQTYDDLGLVNMALYSRINNPIMMPASASPALTGAVFTDSQLSDAFFDKTQVFRGAFGTADWTKPWCNYVPQQTAYN
jgi:hypothetical protein